MHTYRKLDEYISRIDEPNQSACHALVAQYKDIIERALGSTEKHQAWVG